MIRYYRADSINAGNGINKPGLPAFNRVTNTFLYSSTGSAPLIDKARKRLFTQVNGSFVGGDPLYQKTFSTGGTGYLSLTYNQAVNLSNFSCTFRVKHTQDGTIQCIMGVVNTTTGGSATQALQITADTQDTSSYSADSWHVFIRGENNNRIIGYFTNSSIKNNWRTITITVENNAFRAFVDGVSQSITHTTQTNPTSFVAWQHPIYIGARDLRGTADNFFKGLISLASFDDKALSDASAIRIYKNIKKGVTNEVRLPFWFNPGAGGGPTQQSVSGSITPTGALTNTLDAVESMTGSSTIAGTLNIKVSKNLTGSITPSGSLTFKQFLDVSGSITPSGTLATRQFVGKTNTGSITTVGILLISTKKNLDGSITPDSDLILKTKKNLSGSVTSTGTVNNTQFITLTGSITPSGTLTSSGPFVPAPSEPSQGTSSSLIQRIRRRLWT